MTTIAANLECMAADTRVTEDGCAPFPATKIFRVGQSLFGSAGHGDMCLVMIEWLKTSRNRMALYKQWGDYDRDQIALLELNPKGLFRWTGWGIPEQVIGVKHYAIGSGQVAALKGMDKGESPEEAVRGAVNYDIYTGNPIQVEYLLPPELTRRKRKR